MAFEHKGQELPLCVGLASKVGICKEGAIRKKGAEVFHKIFSIQNESSLDVPKPHLCNYCVGMVHVDYTAAGGPLRLESLFPEEAAQLKQTPFAVIQVARLDIPDFAGCSQLCIS